MQVTPDLLQPLFSIWPSYGRPKTQKSYAEMQALHTTSLPHLSPLLALLLGGAGQVARQAGGSKTGFETGP